MFVQGCKAVGLFVRRLVEMADFPMKSCRKQLLEVDYVWC